MQTRFFLSVAFLVTTPLQPQQPRPSEVTQPTVAGVIRDVDGVPISDVEVGIVRGERLQQFVTTGPDGRFLLTGLPSAIVPLRIRRLGYAIQFRDVDARLPSSATLDIVLKAVANELDEVTIAGTEQVRLREFYEHKGQRGTFARFLEQSEIRRLGPTNSSDLFRSVPGIVIASAATGAGYTIRIRGCQPMLWVDRQRVPGAELDEVIKPEEIDAIEFYPSSAGIPAQYLERGNRLCGLILVWTKTQ